MAEYKESKDNPLHKEFGVWSNTVYILRKVKQYCPAVIWIASLGIIAGSALSLYGGIFGKYVIDLIGQELPVDEKLYGLLKILLIAGAIVLVLNFCNTFSYNKKWYRFIYVRSRMITERVSRVLNLDYETLERPDILDIHERANEATGGNNNGVEGMMNLMCTLGNSIFTVAVTMTAVTILDWRLILALAAIGVLQFLHFRYLVKKDKKEVWDRLAPLWRRVNYMSRVTQDFDYAKDIRLFGLGPFLVNKQKKIYSEREERIDWHHELWFRHSLIVQFLFLIGKALIYAVLFYAVLKKGLSIGNFTMFLAMAMTFSQNLLMLLSRFGDYKKVSLEVDDYRSFMELDLGEQAETIPIPRSDSYEIEFKNVSYRYLKASQNALDGLNLKIKAGERLSVVGLNGAGKTTMIKLLLRLYEPTEGVITLNGTDIRKFKREDYYKLFAPVFQNVEIFAFPVSENVSMRSEGDTDRDRAERCLREAGLENKLAEMKHGLDTALTNIVEDDGIDLSGGEKQKLALARALYKNADIVVLDEPTSALDAIAEQQLYERFDRMIGRKSAVYISHRLASTRFCDRIAMFKEGRMIEYGTYDELMQKDGEYAKMFNLQAKYYKENEESGVGM